MTTSFEMLPNLHIIGIQGSGKGTQTQLLSERYGLTVVSSGNLCRQRGLVDDQLGQKVSNLLQQGILLPDELVFEIISEFLTTQQIKNGLIGDGVIRSLQQYQMYLPLWKKYNLSEPYLIHLQLDDDIATERIIQRGKEDLIKRQDTDLAAIEQRLRHYHQITEPVLQNFAQSQICTINANQTIEMVFSDLTNQLETHFPSLHESN